LLQKGIGIGNGVLDYDLDKKTVVEFLYYHGFIDERYVKNWRIFLNRNFYIKLLLKIVPTVNGAVYQAATFQKK